MLAVPSIATVNNSAAPQVGRRAHERCCACAEGMINGELFLLLPEDDELLQSLNLGLAFKRLVVIKAKEVCGSHLYLLLDLLSVECGVCSFNTHTAKRLS